MPMMDLHLQVTFQPPAPPPTEGNEDTCYHCLEEKPVQRIEAGADLAGLYCVDCITEAVLLLKEHDGEPDERLVVDFEIVRTDKSLPDGVTARLFSDMERDLSED